MHTDVRPKILIVDDVEEVRFLARTVLGQHDAYEFYEAENGREGIDLALKEMPHLILMDALMPVMDGFEAIAVLRSDPRTARIPILMVSALDAHDDKVKALTSGVSDFIAKPFDNTELIIRVNSLLNLYLDYLHKETELSELNSRLEQKVEQRTHALLLKESYTRAILDAAPNLLAVFDSTGDLSDTNQAWEAFFRTGELHTPVKSDFDFLTPYIPKFNDWLYLNAYNPSEWLLLLLGNKDQSYKLKITKDGECFLFSVNARHILPRHNGFDDNSTKENRFIVIFNDITEIERIREERETQIKLASIGKLAAGITHEINTPLTYIKGNVELIRMEVADFEECPFRSELLESMDSIDEGLQRIGNIVDATREITKKGSGKKEKTDIYETLVYAARIVYNRTKYVAPIYLNGVLFDLNTPAQGVRHYCPAIREKLEQVWIIMLNNATDEFLHSSIPYESRRIDMDIVPESDRISVRIRDNARGIPENILTTLFDPFVSSKTHSGMGIGLNIAQSIIHEHDGEITAHNDNGAVFTVTLPLLRE